MHVGMKLAACGTLADDSVGEHNIVDYLLFALNQMGNFSYVDYMKLGNEGPQENSKIMLAKSAVSLGWIVTARTVENEGYQKVPDFKRTAQWFLKGFREGRFGPVILDNVFK